MIRKQTDSRHLVKVIDQIISDVSNGQFLAVSMQRLPNVFDSFFVNIVRVGEASGTLAANLAYLADEMKKSQELRNKVKSAMIYPVIVAIATVALVSFLIFFAFPKILPLFASLNVPLPLPTKILIVVASFLIANGALVAAGLVVFFVGLKVLFMVEAVRRVRDYVLLFLPVFSRLIVDVNMANLARVLSVLLKGGIRIVEAVTITAHTFGNLVYRDELLLAAEEIKKGETLASQLAQRKRLFPILVSGLIEIGENTGNLEENLVYLSDYYQSEAETSLRNLTATLEPILLLGMGLVVGFVAISIITPIYKITQGIGG